MANSVKFSIPEREIDNIGVTFVRKKNGSKHGTITVRQNHLEWTPADHTYPFRNNLGTVCRFFGREWRTQE
jgi:hypothetical protein